MKYKTEGHFFLNKMNRKDTATMAKPTNEKNLEILH